MSDTTDLPAGPYTVIVTALGSIGTTLKVELDIQAVQGGELP